MKRKLFYITQSYYPTVTGGTIMRKAQVDLLKMDFDVEVITPNFHDGGTTVDDGIHYIPFRRSLIARVIAKNLERVGVLEDSLDEWVRNCYEYLRDRLTKDDILFATSGGELACLKLGSLLKEDVGCKLVMNYRDPINYTRNADMISSQWHVVRDKAEAKYLQSAEQVFTSSASFADALKVKYPELKCRIKNVYFGYPVKIDNIEKSSVDRKNINIIYAGTFTSTQKPELIYEVLQKIDKNIRQRFRLIYIGDWKSYPPVGNLRDPIVIHKKKMTHGDVQKYLLHNADIGFLGLRSDYFGLCVPSKIYEYINLGIPCLGLLPKGDAIEIIRNNSIGLAFHYNDIKTCAERLSTINHQNLCFYRKNIQAIRDRFSMDYLFEEMRDCLLNL